jgi:hypothetical protein
MLSVMPAQLEGPLKLSRGGFVLMSAEAISIHLHAYPLR